jgi:AcrR family transcriptional regulator
MKFQRLNREQSREQTKERLLDAAHMLFEQKGFALASVEDITAAAGYSRGAFYSNFTDKTELFFMLLRREGEKIDLEFKQLFQEPFNDPVDLANKIAGHYGTLYRSSVCSILWMEAKIVAIRDDKFRDMLSVFLKERYNQIAEFVTIFSTLTNTKPSAPPDEIAIGLMSLCEGVSFAHRCEPNRVDEKTAEAVLAFFLKASIAMQSEATPPGNTPAK